MAEVFHDRVKETGTGTNGNFTLLGAVAQYQDFSGVGNGNECCYTVVDADGIKWGTFSGVWQTGGTLTRVTTHESSTGGAVTFSGGTHTIFLTPDSRYFPATTTPGGSDTQVQFNDSSVLAGDAGMTYDKTSNVLSLNGSANSLSLAGSATGNPVAMMASGSDTDVAIKFIPKGDSGFLQLGDTTFGVAGWAGYNLGFELYSTFNLQYAYGQYNLVISADVASSNTTAVYAQANSDAASTQSITGLRAMEAYATNYGNGNAASIVGLNSVVSNNGSGAVTSLTGLFGSTGNPGSGNVGDAFAFYAGPIYNQGSGVITRAAGLNIEGINNGGTGSITTGYGLRVANITGAGTNYSCWFGTGSYHFDALTASNWVLTDASKNLVSKTNTEATALLDAFVGDSGAGGTKGLVPAPATGDATKFLKGNGSWAAVPGGGDALTTNSLAQFAATTSLELKGVISDETGSGALVFANTPTLVTPVLGTPTSGTLTNCTGLPLAGVVDSTTEALGVGSLEIGHASDTTLTRVSAGVAAIEGKNIALNGTAETLTTGTIELGAASDTTIARASAGVVSIEGNNVVVNTSSPTLATITTTGNIELGHASDTTLARVSAGVASIEGKNIALNGTGETLTTGTIELGAASDTTIARVSAGKASIEGNTILTVAGDTLTGSITLGENTSIALDPAGSADGKYSGITVTGTGGAVIAFGDLVTLDKDDSRWELVDISVAAAATGDARGILAMAVTSSTDGGALTVLLHGIIRADANFPALTIGAPVYASTTGDVVVTQPTTTDHVIRIVGYALTADELYFNPGNVWTTHT